MFLVLIHVAFCIVTDHCYILCKHRTVRFYVSLKGERGSKVNHHVHMTKTGRASTCSISRLECQILMSYMDFAIDRFDDFASLSFFYPNEYMTGVGPAHGLCCKTL